MTPEEKARLDLLFPEVLDELSRAASAQLKRDRNATFKPSDLVNEVYVKLSAAHSLTIESKPHLRALAIRAMRHIVLDRARRRQVKITLVTGIGGAPIDTTFLAFNHALTQLEKEYPRPSRVFEAACFSNMTHEEIAELLDISLATVGRELKFARAFVTRIILDSVSE